MSALTIDRDAYRFFRANAGYVVGRRAEGALNLARAESKLRAQLEAADPIYRVRWEEDDSPLEMGDIPADDWRPYVEAHGVMGCVIERRCSCCGKWETVASLWGIVGGSDYHRLIEAELASELFD